jgi:hypothetical protein
MKTKIRFCTYVLPAIFCMAALAPLASAGCGDASKLQPPFQIDDQQAATLTAHAVTPSGGPGFNSPFITATPVGMWNVKFLAAGNATRNPPIPDNVPVDFGYVQWHSDGTEIMNSGEHQPATQNFCLGVWVRTGLFTYEVNHFALSYDATSGNLAAKVNIREQITLGPSGNEYSGTFTINIFDASSGQQVDHIAGNIYATRVTVDQTQP